MTQAVFAVSRSKVEASSPDGIEAAMFQAFMSESGMKSRETVVAVMTELGLSKHPEYEEFFKCDVSGKEVVATYYQPIKKARKKHDNLVEVPQEEMPDNAAAGDPLEMSGIAKQVAEKLAGGATSATVVFQGVFPVDVTFSIRDEEKGDAEVKVTGRNFAMSGSQKNDDDGTIRRRTKKALLHALMNTQTEAFKTMVAYLMKAGVTKNDDFERMMDKQRSMLMRVNVSLETTKTDFYMPMVDDAPDDADVKQLDETIKVRSQRQVTTSMAMMEDHVIKYVYDNIEGGEKDTNDYEIVIVFAPQGDQKWLCGGLRFL